jgi:hypothetical protein
MPAEVQPAVKIAAAQAVGRCHGALFFLVFGGGWLSLGAYAFGHLSPLLAGFIAASGVTLAVTALRFRRRGRDAAVDAIPQAVLRRTRRGFAILNAVMWTAIFLLFRFLPRFGLGDFSIPAVVLLVGIHFFVMPPLFRHRDNLIAGACLTGWAIVCSLAFYRDRIIAFAATGAGVILWAAAIRGIITARQLLKLNRI